MPWGFFRYAERRGEASDPTNYRMKLSLNRGAIILFGLSAQILITALFLWRFVPHIEDHLTRAGREALARANYSWARVKVSGRDLTVSGIAPDTTHRERVVALLETVPGVRVIRDELLTSRDAPARAAVPEREALVLEMEREVQALRPDLPYGFRIDLEAGVATMSGSVPDATAKESLLGLASQRFGGDRIIDRLYVDPDAPPNYLHAVSQSITYASRLAEGTVGVRDNLVFVQGITETDPDDLKAYVEESIPDGYATSVQLGQRTELESLLRANPNLAARVGQVTMQSRTRNATVTRVADEPIRGAAAIERCQQDFDRLLSQNKIRFETASSDIDESSRALLDDLVDAAKSCPDARIEIGGHTDDQGSRTNNLNLSQRRAESVMAYLVTQGVSLGRLTAVGYGEEQPLVENRTAEDRAVNRRIEFEIQ